jgi:hypothetical protein
MRDRQEGFYNRHRTGAHAHRFHDFILSLLSFLALTFSLASFFLAFSFSPRMLHARQQCHNKYFFFFKKKRALTLSSLETAHAHRLHALSACFPLSFSLFRSLFLSQRCCMTTEQIIFLKKGALTPSSMAQCHAHRLHASILSLSFTLSLSLSRFLSLFLPKMLCARQQTAQTNNQKKEGFSTPSSLETGAHA